MWLKTRRQPDSQILDDLSGRISGLPVNRDPADVKGVHLLVPCSSTWCSFSIRAIRNPRVAHEDQVRTFV